MCPGIQSYGGISPNTKTVPYRPLTCSTKDLICRILQTVLDYVQTRPIVLYFNMMRLWRCAHCFHIYSLTRVRVAQGVTWIHTEDIKVNKYMHLLSICLLCDTNDTGDEFHYILQGRNFCQNRKHLRFHSPIKLIATIQLKYCWKWR